MEIADFSLRLSTGIHRLSLHTISPSLPLQIPNVSLKENIKSIGLHLFAVYLMSQITNVLYSTISEWRSLVWAIMWTQRMGIISKRRVGLIGLSFDPLTLFTSRLRLVRTYWKMVDWKVIVAGSVFTAVLVSMSENCSLIIYFNCSTIPIL